MLYIISIYIHILTYICYNYIGRYLHIHHHISLGVPSTGFHQNLPGLQHPVGGCGAGHPAADSLRPAAAAADAPRSVGGLGSLDALVANVGLIKALKHRETHKILWKTHGTSIIYSFFFKGIGRSWNSEVAKFGAL